ncbi:armadillo-type protein [Sphaerosporella brunnea]|uniref:Armadillo-type protein n=1 Tax=Sphaerosporella brunnea TaxID=1250544 RepID=A0A5J5FC59_9PEZI|nr:armadillo-type protein [Sphaerosporella brunnea]
MTTTVPPAYAVQSLLEKMASSDCDFRFMALNDLLGMLAQNTNFSQADLGSMSKLTDAVVRALDDANGEVQNLAVKCLGPLVLRIKENQIGPLIDRLAVLSMTSPDPSIPSTALRTIITNLPRPHTSHHTTSAFNAALQRGQTASTATPARPEASQQAIQAAVVAVQKTLIPKLLALLRPDEDVRKHMGAILDSIALLIETVRCFGTIMTGAEVERLQVAVMNLVQNERISGVIKKRAVIGLSLLCIYAPDELLSSLINHIIESFHAESKNTKPSRLRLLISVTDSLARGIPDRFGPHLKTICPFVLSVVDGKDLEDRELGDEPDLEMDEVRETALVALDSFQSCCTKEMKPFLNDLINASTLFLKYDPNYADPGDDEEMGGTGDEGDGGSDEGAFEDDGAFSDEDDMSWKVRRCAAKLLSTVLSTRAGDLIRGSKERGGVAYRRLAPLLVERFHEREENVRLEILATFTVLVRKTGEVADGSATKATDTQGVRASLRQLVPRLSKSLGKLLNNKSVTLPTKQASVVLLNAVVSSVRIEVLRLFSKIFENHSLETVNAYLKAAVSAICAAVNENAYKVSFEALGTVASVIKLLTTPGAPVHAKFLGQLYEAIIKKVDNADTAFEVREKAVITLSFLLNRTSGKPGALPPGARRHALDGFLDRLKNETTRFSSAHAIDIVAKTAVREDQISRAWTQAVVAELGGQLRKSNRALKAASLDALKSIASNDILREHLDAVSKWELVAMLTPMLVVGDMQLLGLSIAMLRLMILSEGGHPGISVTSGVISGICSLVKSPLGSGVVLENLLALIATIGESDAKGKRALMNAFLKNVGVTGDTNVVAKAIAQLLVSGGGDRGGFIVGVKDFVTEVESVRDDDRKCLALMVLGEIGLRMRKAFTVPPETFLSQLNGNTDNVPIAAAAALGLAGAGNVDKFVPVIMRRLQGGNDSYLLVHSLKEIITHSSADALQPYTSHMWDTLLSTAVTNDDSKAVAAECVGRLIILDPYTFLPELQKHLKSQESVVRGLAMSALRFTFMDTDTTYDECLRVVVVAFLETMLQDWELDNRRLALTALTSAATNKSHLLAGAGLEKLLLPHVYAESIIKPELVREIQMGPFRHRVDDGLEVRKSAYETLYSLLETSFSSIDLDTYFQRVIAGIGDEHDIRALANLMLAKLAVLAKDETAKRLDAIADVMKKVLGEKPKENAVKQELEKHSEGVRGVVVTAVVVQREIGGAARLRAYRWRAFWDWLQQGFRDLVLEAGGADA